MNLYQKDHPVMDSCLSILPIKLKLSLRKGSAAGILSTLPYRKNRMKIVEKLNKITLCGRNVKLFFAFSVIMGLPVLHLVFIPHEFRSHSSWQGKELQHWFLLPILVFFSYFLMSWEGMALQHFLQLQNNSLAFMGYNVVVVHISGLQ